MNKKYILFSFILLAIIISSIIFTAAAKKEHARANKPTYLCDAMTDDCNKDNHRMPKGVCIPKGKCT